MMISAEEQNRLSKSLSFVLKWEGGYSNDPRDPGGETKFGISKRAHPTEDIKNLSPERCLEIYYHDYWIPSSASKYPYPNCLAILDTAVNLGVARSLIFLGSNPTLESFDVQSYITNRVMYYIQIVKKNPTLQIYMKGWMNRVADLKKLIEIQGTAEPDTTAQT